LWDASYEDLEASLQIFLRKAKRRAAERRAMMEPADKAIPESLGGSAEDEAANCGGLPPLVPDKPDILADLSMKLTCLQTHLILHSAVPLAFAGP
jgi:hypothetical protein